MDCDEKEGMEGMEGIWLKWKWLVITLQPKL